MSSIIQSTKNWLAKPFDPEGSAANWFLFVGLLLAICFLWSRITTRIV